MSKLCDVTGCPNAATHQAELVIYGRSAKLHPPAIGTMGIQVCDEHADKEHADALLSEPGKRRIESGFAGIGRALPDWTRSFVRWRKL